MTITEHIRVDIQLDLEHEKKLAALVARLQRPATPNSIVAELIDAAYEQMADELTAAAEDATRWESEDSDDN